MDRASYPGSQHTTAVTPARPPLDAQVAAVGFEDLAAEREAEAGAGLLRS